VSQQTGGTRDLLHNGRNGRNGPEKNFCSPSLFGSEKDQTVSKFQLHERTLNLAIFRSKKTVNKHCHAVETNIFGQNFKNRFQRLGFKIKFKVKSKQM
jgi:hypothetical protein